MHDDAGEKQGIVADGGLTDDSSPVISGGGQVPGSIITVRDGDRVLGTVVAGPDGSWRFEAALSAGEHHLTATVTDAAGRESARSAPWTFTLDLEAPGRAVLETVVGEVPVLPGGETGDSTPELRGRGEAGGKVIIYDRGVEIGRAPVGADGTWSFTPSPPLAAGGHVITVRATDAAGNAGLPSEPFAFTVSPEAPGLALERVSDDAGAQKGDVPAGGSTDDAAPELHGRATPGAEVRIYEGERLLGTARADGEGRWAFTPPPLAEAWHSLSVSEMTPAGESARTPGFRIEVDTTPPATPEAGEPEEGDVTNEARPVMTGRAEPGTRLFIEYSRAGDAAPIVVEVEVGADGGWCWQPEEALGDGKWTFRTYAEDTAGNRSGYSETWEAKVDTTPPEAPTGYSVSDGKVTVSFDGADLEPGDRILLRVGDEWFEYALTEADIAAGRVTMEAPGATMMNVSAGLEDRAGNASDHVAYAPLEIENFNRLPPIGFVTPETKLNGFSLKSGEVMIGYRYDTRDKGLRINETEMFKLSEGKSASGIEFKYAGPAHDDMNVTLILYAPSGEKYTYHFTAKSSPAGLKDVFRIELPDGLEFTEFSICAQATDGSPYPYILMDDIGFTGGDYGGGFEQVPPPVPDETHITGKNDGITAGAKGVTGADPEEIGSETGMEILRAGDSEPKLNLRLEDVLSRGESDLFFDSGTGASQLMLRDDGAGMIDLSGEENWSGHDSVTVGGAVYEVYRHASQEVELQLQQGLNVNPL